MKKEILSFLLIPLVLTACGNQNKSSEETTASNDNVQVDNAENTAIDFLSDFERCKNKDYVNLELSNSNIRLPELDFLCNLNLTFQKRFYSTEEMLALFEKYCENFFGKYDSSNALFSSLSSNIPIEEGDGKYAWYPKVDDYLEELQGGAIEADMLMYRDVENNNYLWWIASSDFPHWISKGEAYSFIKTDETRISAWIPSDMDNKTASYLNNGEYDDKTYHLPDSDVTVGEAVKYFENDYLPSLPYKFDENYSVSVSSVDVYNIKDDTYCYVLNFSSSWKGIPFDRKGEYFSYQDTSDQYSVSGEALMIKKDDIDTIVNLTFNPAKEEEPIENIYTLEKAVDIISDKLTKEVKFELQTVEFIYRGSFSEDRTEADLEPTWKFAAYNPNDEMYYCVYVNATSGQCSYISYVPF